MQFTFDPVDILDELKNISVSTALTRQKCEETDTTFNSFVSEFRMTTKEIQGNIQGMARDLDGIKHQLTDHTDRLNTIDQWISDHSHDTSTRKLTYAKKEGKFEAYKAFVIGISAIIGSLITTIFSYVIKYF